jgi:hypothetical protein
MALTSDGRVYTFGSNLDGQTGHGADQIRGKFKAKANLFFPKPVKWCRLGNMGGLGGAPGLPRQHQHQHQHQHQLSPNAG